jgi:hypothetical protein
VRVATWATVTAGAGALIAGLWGCPSASRVDGLNAAQLPAGIQDDYGLFAQRCSKCHSLSRSLESGITDDGYWKAYVERMRRQPSSGISLTDETPILRFLHYYSTEQKRGRGQATEDGG